MSSDRWHSYTINSDGSVIIINLDKLIPTIPIHHQTINALLQNVTSLRTERQAWRSSLHYIDPQSSSIFMSSLPSLLSEALSLDLSHLKKPFSRMYSFFKPLTLFITLVVSRVIAQTQFPETKCDTYIIRTNGDPSCEDWKHSQVGFIKPDGLWSLTYSIFWLFFFFFFEKVCNEILRCSAGCGNNFIGEEKNFLRYPEDVVLFCFWWWWWWSGGWHVCWLDFIL